MNILHNNGQKTLIAPPQILDFEQELNWTRKHIPHLKKVMAIFPVQQNIRLACSMHIDRKVIPFLEELMNKNIELFVLTCNPNTVRNEAVAYLQSRGAIVKAWHNMSPTEYANALESALDWQPTHVCEMGADLTTALLKRDASARPAIKASLEATGSGITRLNGVLAPYPIFNWDDLPVKEGLHNRYLVGLSTWQTFFARTRLTLHEKKVLIIGFGSVGRGVADAARTFGGNVIIAEKDPGRRLEAEYAGWNTCSLDEGLSQANVIVTATGVRHLIGKEHLNQLKNGTFLINVSHINDEIDVVALGQYPHNEALPFVEEFILDQNRSLYLFANGTIANLTAGEGDSINAFDVTLAVMANGIRHITGKGQSEKPGIYLLPRAAWQEGFEG